MRAPTPRTRTSIERDSTRHSHLVRCHVGRIGQWWRLWTISPLLHQGGIVLRIETPLLIPRAAQASTLPGGVTAGAQAGQADDQSRRLAAERALDEVLAESFPASDPPSWTLGIARPAAAQRVEDNAARGAIATNADKRQPAAVGLIDVAQPSRDEQTVIGALISIAAASGIVLLVPFVILLVGLPIALLVRGFVEAATWLLP
jgi:hypothetical protein